MRFRLVIVLSLILAAFKISYLIVWAKLGGHHFAPEIPLLLHLAFSYFVMALAYLPAAPLLWFLLRKLREPKNYFRTVIFFWAINVQAVFLPFKTFPGQEAALLAELAKATVVGILDAAVFSLLWRGFEEWERWMSQACCPNSGKPR